MGREKSYLRRDIPVFRGLQYLNENDHGKVPACSSVYILLYEEWQVFVLENYNKRSFFKSLYPRVNLHQLSLADDQKPALPG